MCLCVCECIHIHKAGPDECDTLLALLLHWRIFIFFLQCFRFEFTFHFAQNAPKEPTTYPTAAAAPTLSLFLLSSLN